MQSLSDLNGYGQTALDYTDVRLPAVIFDRVTPLDQNIFVAQGSEHQVPAGINIVEIIDPVVMDVYYEIDISSMPGATFAWATVPAGCVATEPSAGVYRMSNIQTAEQWILVRNPTIDIVLLQDDFTYTATIGYGTSDTKTWSVNAVISVIATLNSVSTQVSTASATYSMHSFMPTNTSITAVGGGIWQYSAILPAHSFWSATPYDFTKASATLSSVTTSVITAQEFDFLEPEELVSTASIVANGAYITNANNNTFTTSSTVSATGVGIFRDSSIINTEMSVDVFMNTLVLTKSLTPELYNESVSIVGNNDLYKFVNNYDSQTAQHDIDVYKYNGVDWAIDRNISGSVAFDLSWVNHNRLTYRNYNTSTNHVLDLDTDVVYDAGDFEYRLNSTGEYLHTPSTYYTDTTIPCRRMINDDTDYTDFVINHNLPTAGFTPGRIYIERSSAVLYGYADTYIPNIRTHTLWLLSLENENAIEYDEFSFETAQSGTTNIFLSGSGNRCYVNNTDEDVLHIYEKRSDNTWFETARLNEWTTPWLYVNEFNNYILGNIPAVVYTADLAYPHAILEASSGTMATIVDTAYMYTNTSMSVTPTVTRTSSATMDSTTTTTTVATRVYYADATTLTSTATVFADGGDYDQSSATMSASTTFVAIPDNFTRDGSATLNSSATLSGYYSRMIVAIADTGEYSIAPNMGISVEAYGDPY